MADPRNELEILASLNDQVTPGLAKLKASLSGFSSDVGADALAPDLSDAAKGGAAMATSLRESEKAAKGTASAADQIAREVQQANREAKKLRDSLSIKDPKIGAGGGIAHFGWKTIGADAKAAGSAVAGFGDVSQDALAETRVAFDQTRVGIDKLSKQAADLEAQGGFGFKAGVGFAVVSAGVEIVKDGFARARAELVGAVQQAAAFDEAFSRAGANLRARGEETDGYRAQVRELALELGQDALAAARTFYAALEESGGRGEEALERLRVALTLTTAGFGEQEDNVRRLSTIQQVFGDTSGTMAEQADLLAAASQRGTTELGQLAGVVSDLGPQARELGADLDDVLALFLALVDRGQSSRQALLNTKRVFDQLFSQAGRENLRKVGIDFSEAQVRAEGFLPFLQRVSAEVAANEDALEQASPSFKGLGGTLRALGDDSDALARQLAFLATSSGSVAAVAREQLNSDFRVLDTTAKGLRETLAELFGDRVLKGAADLVRRLNENKDAMDGLKAVADVALGKLADDIVNFAGVQTEAAAATTNLAQAVIDHYTALSRKLAEVVPGVEDLAKSLQGVGEDIATGLGSEGQKELERTGDIIRRLFSGDEVGGLHQALAQLNDQIRRMRPDEAVALAESLQVDADAAAQVSANIAGIVEQMRAAVREKLSAGDLIGASESAAAIEELVKEVQDLGLVGSTLKFDALKALEEDAVKAGLQLDKTSGTILEIEGRLVRLVDTTRDADGQVRILTESLNAVKLDGIFDTPVFSRDDLQRKVVEALDEVRKQDPTLLLGLSFAPTEIQDALRQLEAFRDSADFIVGEGLPDSRKQAIQELITSIGLYTGALKEANDAQSKLSVDALADSAKQKAEVEREAAGYEELARKLEGMGLQAGKLREAIAAFRTQRTIKIDADSAAKAEADAERDLQKIQRADDKARRLTEAAIAAGFRVSDIFRDMERAFVTGAEAERKAVNDTIDKAIVEIEKLAREQPQVQGELPTLLKQLEDFRVRLTLQVDARAYRAELEAGEEKFLRMREAASGVLSGVPAQLAQINLGLQQELKAIRQLESADDPLQRISAEHAKRLADFARLRADLATQDVVIGVSLRPQFDVDSEKLADQFKAFAGPQVADLQAQLGVLLDAPNPDQAAIIQTLDAIRERLVALRNEFLSTSEAFEVGFAAGFEDQLAKFSNAFERGYHVATDSIDALASNLGSSIDELLKHGASAGDIFLDFTRNFLADLQSIISQALANALIGKLLGLFSGGFGGGSASPGIPGFPFSPQARGGILPGSVDNDTVRSFAQGGIGGGGIARGDQYVRIADNPSHYEAFVPLPGPNRGIPVEITRAPQGGADGGGGDTINVVVNYSVSQIDAKSGEQFVESHARKIGDLVAQNLASGRSRKMTLGVRSANRG